MLQSELLQLLIGPDLGSRILGHIWPTKPCWYHGPADRLANILQLSCLQHPRTLLELPVQRITVQANVKDSNPIRRIVGKGGLSGTERADLMALYEAGFQLYFHELSDLPASLERLLQSIADSLSVSRSVLAVNAFACVAGSAHTPPLHWDPSESLLIQCQGIKHWQIAENGFFSFPTFNHSFGSDIASDYRDDFDAEYPQQRPAVQALTVRPGSVVFVPRGAWHCATAETDSLHLDINIKTPNLSVALSSWVNRRLRQQIELRRPVTLDESEELVERALERARRVLHDLADELGVAELVRLGVLDVHRWPHRYRRTDDVQLAWTATDKLQVRLDDDACEITLSGATRPSAEWLVEREPGPDFGVTELPWVNATVLPLLELLEDLGALERVPDRSRRP